MEKGYLFIAGCARSGTSALTRIIGSHKEIVLGMERFGRLVEKGNFQLTPEHFTKERFLDVQEGDTFYTDFDKIHSWDSNIRNKVNHDHLRYIGDKKPGLYNVYNEVFDKFPKTKIIFIHRDPLQVMSSWDQRFQKGNGWPASRDFRKAVYAWNNSLKCTLSALSKYSNQIGIVNYSEVFEKQTDLNPIYEWLGVDMDELTIKKIASVREFSDQLRLKRANVEISDEQRNFCLKTAKYDLEQSIGQFNLLKKNRPTSD